MDATDTINEIEEKKETAIRLLIAGLSKKAAAAEVGISRTTLYAWLENPDFLARLNSAAIDENNTNIQRRLAEQRAVGDRLMTLQRAMVRKVTDSSVDKQGKLVRMPSVADLSALERIGRLASNIRSEERMNMGLTNNNNNTTINIGAVGGVNATQTQKLSDRSFKDFIGDVTREEIARASEKHVLGDVVVKRLLTSGILDEIRDAELVNTDE